MRTFSSVGTAVLGNFRTVLLIFASAFVLGELQDWAFTRYIGCFNTFMGAAAYGLHPMLFGSPVTRLLPRSVVDEVKDVRKDALAEELVDQTEREGLATPCRVEEEVDEHFPA